MKTWQTKKLSEIVLLVKQALESISDNDSSVWNTTEWNICHHTATALQKRFNDFDIDVEPIKDDKRRPDIVVHSRGTQENNLVVFQVKKHPNFNDIKTDLDKIRDTFFREPYNYKYGIFISIGKLPHKLPEFDRDRINIHEVYGWKVITNEAGRKQ